jgi:hypothetical protein
MGLLTRFLQGEKLFGKPADKPATGITLDTPLLKLSSKDFWTVRDSFEGTQIFGAIGSGKTSGSGQAIAKAFLKAGYGGLVLTAKKGERELWEKYAEATGRQDLIIVSPENHWRFNFLNYELNRPGKGGGLTENLVALFCHVLEAAERKEQGGGNERFWKDALKNLLRNAIELLKMSKGEVKLEDISRIIESAPATLDQVESPDWQRRSYCAELLYEAEEKAKSPAQEADYAHTRKYWLQDFPDLNPKTRSIITAMFTNMASLFLRSPLRELFSTTTDFLPEHSHNGAVIIIDLPAREYMDVGIYAQMMFKLLWQQSTERREIGPASRPVFLWVDESQVFVNSYDTQFQTTARDRMAATVYLTQNISNYYAMLAGQRAKPETDSLLGNLVTKIFHSQSDAETNRWAAELVGKSWQTRINANVSSSQGGGSSSSRYSGVISDQQSEQSSAGFSEIFEYELPPSSFTTLKKGGPPNGNQVEAILYQGGRTFKHTGKTHLKVTFQQ